MRILSTAGAAIRHGVGAVAEAALVLGIAVVLVFGVAVVARHEPAGAGAVYAAKGGNGGGATRGGTATIAVPNGVFGGVTTASVSGASALWVHVTCTAYSGGAMVGWATADSSGLAVIQLGPTPTWSSGGASCTAEAGSFNNRSQWVVAASTSFNVSG